MSSSTVLQPHKARRYGVLIVFFGIITASHIFDAFFWHANFNDAEKPIAVGDSQELASLWPTIALFSILSCVLLSVLSCIACAVTLYFATSCWALIGFVIQSLHSSACAVHAISLVAMLFQERFRKYVYLKETMFQIMVILANLFMCVQLWQFKKRYSKNNAGINQSANFKQIIVNKRSTAHMTHI
uniref:Uncharacterized protein n=1 Tax=Spongospora subterranea TaxID=70186 RepID=A0A0H5QGV4_9EUKA|eukprot:CRZ01238.1 hypothetical protein [Spongospora subterranea]